MSCSNVVGSLSAGAANAGNPWLFSFRTPCSACRGQFYAGDEPDSFMGREGVARFVTDYAARIAAALRCGVNGTSLRPTHDKRFLLQAGQKLMEAVNVVIATGPYQSPSIPSCSASLPLSVHQVTAN